MLVSEAITHLQYTNLKQLSVKTDNAALLDMINYAITAIHKRFNLMEREAIITMAANVTLYKLDGTDSNVSIDLSDNNLMLIERAYNEDTTEITINDEDDLYGAATPQFDQFEIYQATAGGLISVIYRAAPLFLTSVDDPIPLPIQYMEALYLHVAYQAHGSVKGSIKDENNTHYIRFDKECNQIRHDGLYNPGDFASNKFYDRGFC